MVEERIERRLAAIPRSRRAGYSRLMGVDEEGTLAALKTHRRDVTVRKLLSITVAAPSRQKGPMNRHLAAVLNADVVGYSRARSADEAGTLQLLKTHEIGVIEPAVAKHNGRIVKRMGDGYLAEFASVVDAVECALDWQTQTAGSDRLKFRIGVHLGDI